MLYRRGLVLASSSAAMLFRGNRVRTVSKTGQQSMAIKLGEFAQVFDPATGQSLGHAKVIYETYFEGENFWHHTRLDVFDELNSKVGMVFKLEGQSSYTCQGRDFDFQSAKIDGIVRHFNDEGILGLSTPLKEPEMKFGQASDRRQGL